MPPAAKENPTAIGSALAAVLTPLPTVDKAKVKLVSARTSKARAEWNKIRRQIRRNLKSKGLQCVKINDPTAHPGQPPLITKAYAECCNVDAVPGPHHPGNVRWRTDEHSEDNLAVLQEADLYLYDLLAECYANDEQALAQSRTALRGERSW